MKIGLLSDTHSYIDDDIMTLLDPCDEVWHAGDIGDLAVTERIAQSKPLRAVWGNIDGQPFRLEFPKDQIFTVGGMKVWMTHIGGYPGRYPTRIRERLLQLQPDLFICGHSHILKVMWDKEHSLLHMNPGACGRKGIHTIRTLLRFDIIDAKVKNAQVIELGTRSARAGRKEEEE